MTMDEDKPRVVAFFLDAPIDPADPLAHVRQRARDIDAAQEETGAAERHGHAAARADKLAEVGGLMTDLCLTHGEVLEIMDRSGLGDDDLDAAAYVAILLRQIERGAE
jgi:hypothetical protein